MVDSPAQVGPAKGLPSYHDWWRRAKQAAAEHLPETLATGKVGDFCSQKYSNLQEVDHRSWAGVEADNVDAEPWADYASDPKNCFVDCRQDRGHKWGFDWEAEARMNGEDVSRMAAAVVAGVVDEAQQDQEGAADGQTHRGKVKEQDSTVEAFERVMGLGEGSCASGKARQAACATVEDVQKLDWQFFHA